MACHSYLTGVTSHGPPGFQSPEVEAGGHSEMCRCRISTRHLCVSSEQCVFEWRVSHKTQLPFYQFIKREKQSKYTVIGIIEYTHM